MQLNLNDSENESINRIDFLVGNQNILREMPFLSSREPFSESAIDFLNDVSRFLMQTKESKNYPDVFTLGFWLRKSSMVGIKNKYLINDNNYRLGRGLVFHIAPSNVPVNYAYSLFSGIMTGNANIVRVPSKSFPQIELINEAIKKAIDIHEDMRKYICLIRYEKNQEINDLLSKFCDVRVIWGGDNTISELRKSPIAARTTEVTFADRYSLSVIDSDAYLSIYDKEKIAIAFYNDTYLTDQNACTSPRLVCWTGSKKSEAKEEFWFHLHKLVQVKYSNLQGVQSINKLTHGYIACALHSGFSYVTSGDNFIVRVKANRITSDLMELKDNSGFFFEYDCDDILELKNICDDNRCQTVGYIGNADMFLPLIKIGPKGIDRIVPIGKTMDFDLIWDGYNLTERLTRVISLT